MKLEDVEEARASWMKLEMVCIQLCQGAVSVGCTDKPYIVDSVPDHMVVVAFQKLAAFIPVVVQKPVFIPSEKTPKQCREWITMSTLRVSISHSEHKLTIGIAISKEEESTREVLEHLDESNSAIP